MVCNQKKDALMADYIPANIQLEIVDETKSLGIVLQSNSIQD